jgi:large conductance mechanosensitive channel
MSLGNKLDSFEPAKRVGTLLEEFKNFAFKGNVVDLAVGVIIGAAFGGIIKSLVDNIVMPLVSLVFPGEKGYENWQIIVASHMDGDKQVIDKSIPYGKFLADLLNFIVVAFVLFICIKKFLGWLMRAKKEEAAAPPMTKDQVLLTEIRDLLKQRVAG